MAKPIHMQAASLIPPVHIISSPLWWWCLCGVLELGKLSHGRVILPPLIGTRLAWSSSHLRCCQRASHISWGAAVASFADQCLDACNCLWHLTEDLLSYIWCLGSVLHIWWRPVCYAVPSSEVALCPLLPWYCAIFSWNIWFRDYQYVFYLEKVIFHLGKVYFNLLLPSI